MAIQEVADNGELPYSLSVHSDLRYIRDHPEGPPEKYSRPYKLHHVVWHYQSKADLALPV